MGRPAAIDVINHPLREYQSPLYPEYVQYLLFRIALEGMLR